MLKEPTMTTDTIAEQVSNMSLTQVGAALPAREPDIRLGDVIAVK
jgi:hypothetical protein